MTTDPLRVGPHQPDPEAPVPEAADPEAPVPEATGPEAPGPQALDPKAPAPKALDREAADSKAPVPEATGPEASVPEVSDPQAPVPEAPGPKAPAPMAPDPQTPDPQTPDPTGSHPKSAPFDTGQVDAYLRRIGVERPDRPTVGALRALHLAHLRTVPFENLSVHLGEDIVLVEERLFEKVVGDRRGGFCYELNGLFGGLLTALGFEVTLLQARVFGDEGRVGIPYDHLALLVRTVEGQECLADIGFGTNSHYPLVFGERGEQPDPGGTFRIVEADSGHGDLVLLRDSEPQYRLETRPRRLGDFAVGAWWHSTSPQSHFTRSLVCSRITEDGGRITLSGRTFTVTDAHGVKKTSECATDEETLEVYRARFGVVLDRVPVVGKGA